MALRVWLAALAALAASTAGAQPYIDGPMAQTPWDVGDGFRLSPDTPVAMDPDASKALRDRVRATWRRAGLEEPALVARLEPSESQRAVYIGVAGEEPMFAADMFARLREALAEQPPGSYAVWVSQERVAVAGRDARGRDYALKAFGALLAAHGRNLPGGRLTDGPAVLLRGVMTEKPVSRRYAEALAGDGGNFILFTGTSDAARDGGLGSWREAFALCREAGIEPAPLVELPGYAGMERRALAGGAVSERACLVDDQWVALGMRNARPGAIQVTSGETAYTQGKDFAVQEREGLGCVVWRLIGGAIESGEWVTITYRYAPLDEERLPLRLTEIQTLVREPIDRLLDALEPQWLHIGGGPRSKLRGERRSYLDVDAVSLLDNLVKARDGRTRLMIWAEAGQHLRDLAGEGLAEPASRLPGDLVTVARLAGLSGPEAAEIMAEAAELGRPAAAVAPATELDVHQAGLMLAEQSGEAAGLLVHDAEAAVVTGPVREALAKGWSGLERAPVWAAGLNQYFGSRLTRPAFGEALAAMTRHLNSQTLRGVAPDEERRRFERAAGAVARRTGGDDPALALARSIYGNLLRYLELEWRYSEEEDARAAEHIAELVMNQAALDPEFTKERQQRIVETVRSKGVFVPSTVLFGLQVLPYREVTPPRGAIPLEALAQPAYHDKPHSAAALYDLLAETGPIFRADFETIASAELRLETSPDGERWEPSAVKRSERRGGARPPLMLTTPVIARHVRVAAEAPAGQATLRRVRLTAWKEEPVASCPARIPAPEIDGEFKERAWAGMRPQAANFVCVTRGGLAHPPTTVYLCRTREALFVAAYMREDRPDTLVAGQTRRDAPLWEEESFEVRLKPGGGETFRFVVNPRSARFDSLGGGADWDGAWTVAARRYPGGWSVEMRVPFETLGVPARPGAEWSCDFVRNRKNVREETSSWAYRAETPWRGEAWGRLILE